MEFSTVLTDSFLWFTTTEAQQYGAVFAGPGAKINFTRPMVPPILPKLSFVQQELVTQAKKYAMETSIKSVLVKQVIPLQNRLRLLDKRPFFIL